MNRTNKKGFTIVELVIVIAVIAILAAVLIPNLSRLVDKANESKALQEAESAMKLDLINADGDYNNLTADNVVTLGEKKYVAKSLATVSFAADETALTFAETDKYSYYDVSTKDVADSATAGHSYYQVSKTDDTLVVKGVYDATAKTYTVNGYTFNTVTGEWTH